jgi:hypothetical protein
MIETAGAAVLPVAKAGHFMHFFVAVITSAPIAVGRYHEEFLRLLADVSWDNGFTSSRTARR